MYFIPVAFDFWNPVDVPGSVEEDEGVVILSVVASNVVLEVDGWLRIMGLGEEEELMDNDVLLLTYWFVNVDDSCLPPPSSWLHDFEIEKKNLKNLIKLYIILKPINL